MRILLQSISTVAVILFLQNFNFRAIHDAVTLSLKHTIDIQKAHSISSVLSSNTVPLYLMCFLRFRQGQFLRHMADCLLGNCIRTASVAPKLFCPIRF